MSNDALLLLEQAITAHKARLKGYERPSEVLAFETTRALDVLFCRELFTGDDRDSSQPTPYSTMSWGTNQALHRIVPDVFESGPFRLFRSTEQTQRKADDFLFECGCLQKAERLVGWLKEGLIEAEARPVELSSNPETEFLLLLKIADPSLYVELMGRRGLRWGSDLVMKMDRAREEDLERRHLEILPDLERAVDVFGGWGIRYASTEAIDEYFMEWAKLYLRRMYGQDVLGPEDIIGGRPFSEYLGMLVALSGRAQKHLCFASILARRHPKLSLQNLLTTFSPFSEFVVRLARHLDADTLHVQRLLSHLTLAPDNKRLHLATSETAWTPLIRAGSDSLILPVFGLDINPFLFLLTDLREKYPREWFEAANRREARWIQEFRHLFPASRWRVGANAKLRREQKIVTDIDFWAMDVSGNVALFQLKWQQPVGMDNRARRSAGKNLVTEGNRWIETVSTWLEQNGKAGLARCLGTGDAPIGEIKLFVVARYNAWFAGFGNQAPSATWTDWNHLMKARFDQPASGVVEFHDVLNADLVNARASVWSESYAMPLHNLAILLNPTPIKKP